MLYGIPSTGVQPYWYVSIETKNMQHKTTHRCNSLGKEDKFDEIKRVWQFCKLHSVL